jgi:hypothetical protein
MIKDRRILSAPPPDPLPAATLDIETFSYEERRVIFPAITRALELFGCWLLDRRPLSFTHVEFYFELQLRSVVDLYAALIAAGLELTRASHQHLTTLCTVRKHHGHPLALPGIVTVRLQINFLEDSEPILSKSSGASHA